VLPECILDGEIVVLDGDGVEQLELLQMRAGDKNARMMNELPVTVKFFDILELEGEDLRSLTLWRRRRYLEETVGQDFVVEILDATDVADIPAHWEGTVSKLSNSIYESGKRRSTWLKYKFVQRATLRATALTAGKGGRANSFGAVVVSDANGVRRGQVGSGFTQADIDALMAAQATGNWPLIEVEYRFLSKTGLMVNTAFKGIRTDKKEADDLG
jgi:bifunctional non-homologous end joining protein LigD